jgi:hypothetical protein
VWIQIYKGVSINHKGLIYVWIQNYKGIELIIRVLYTCEYKLIRVSLLNYKGCVHLIILNYKGLIYVLIQTYKGSELIIRVVILNYNKL